MTFHHSTSTSRGCGKLLTLVLTALVLTGCGTTTVDSTIPADFVDASITEYQRLGWLGAESHPLRESITFPDGDEEVTPGGIVLCTLLDGGAAQSANLRRGDVIVRVADDWLPNREDPTLDLMGLCEQQLSAGNQSFEITIVRKGGLETATIETQYGSLDEGLPLSVARLTEACNRGLTYLVGLQQPDGSFAASAKDDQAAVLRTTSMVGLALLAGGAKQDDSPFHETVNKCQQFIEKCIDEHLRQPTPSDDALTDDGDASTTEPTEPTEPTDPTKPTESKPTNAIATATTDFDSITVAYLMQFLAEADVDMLDMNSMKRLAALVATISDQQLAHGGWSDSNQSTNPNVEEMEIPQTTIDVSGTYVTSQVLLGLGMLERKGMMADASTVKKACGYLKKQAEARVGNPLDRRTKSALAAMTGAALLGVGCDRSDGFLTGLVKENIERAAEIIHSPQLGIPGFYACGLMSRQMSNDVWTQLLGSIRYQLVSLQHPDGSFADVLRTKDTPLTIEAASNSDAWRAAHFSLLFALQGDHVNRLTAQADNPMIGSRDSSGNVAKRSRRPGRPIGIPEGAQVIMLEGGDLDDLKEKLKDKLKDLGGDVQIDLDSIETQVIEVDGDQ